MAEGELVEEEEVIDFRLAEFRQLEHHQCLLGFSFSLCVGHSAKISSSLNEPEAEVVESVGLMTSAVGVEKKA